MQWEVLYGSISQPRPEQIIDYIHSPLWEELCGYLEETYGVSPKFEFSRCAGKPGWNIKYKKSGRSLCTLYPDDGFFTCLVTIGRNEAAEAELLIHTCTGYVKELYESVYPMNGAKWLMIEVREQAVLDDVKALIGARAKKTKRSGGRT